MNLELHMYHGLYSVSVRRALGIHSHELYSEEGERRERLLCRVAIVCSGCRRSVRASCMLLLIDDELQAVKEGTVRLMIRTTQVQCACR